MGLELGWLSNAGTGDKWGKEGAVRVVVSWAGSGRHYGVSG